MQLELSKVESPQGDVWMAASATGICALGFASTWDRLTERLKRRFGEVHLQRCDTSRASEAVRRYFDGELNLLDSLAVDPGGTPFQTKVWTALRRVGPGEVTTYGELAKVVGASKAARAVGTANAQNPVSLVIPCHRVVQSSGRLGGYAGGVERKAWLLDHEGSKVENCRVQISARCCC